MFRLVFIGVFCYSYSTNYLYIQPYVKETYYV
jgi:hypothetical protein